MRIRVRLPHPASARELSRLSDWLHNRVGRGNYALHGAETETRDLMVVYFQRLEHVQTFMAAFPDLTLADAAAGQGVILASVPSRQAG